MALPKIETPKYFLTIPSTQEVIEYRPFLVKEEKVLMMAHEAGTQISMITALKDLIKSCTFGALDLYELPMCDLEYILLQIRAKSAGEKAKFKLNCGECDHQEEIELDLTKIEVQGDDQGDNKMQLTDSVGVTLRLPNLKDAERSAKKIGKNKNELVESIASIIESVYDENEVYPFDQATPKEIEEFIDSLSTEQVEKINSWVLGMPSLRKEIEFTCPNNHENKHILSGLGDFFS